MRTSLNRRTFLRGTGVAIALPMLEAMIPVGRADAIGARGALPEGSGGTGRDKHPGSRDRHDRETVRIGRSWDNRERSSLIAVV